MLRVYHPQKTLRPYFCKTDSNVGSIMRIITISIQLALQQCCKTSCMFFAARFTVA